ncbi:phage repressor protein C with HTH and peptisase S24 domain [Novosphingobium kunmingense]|uniref:Phage repressor protein C with HTH and peptisase S24 domain n=1 Tax=Novosphingobium kunmingense TaxID=1211806 RepID=A0A2N0I1K5_9SPHN|nr:S24 family peptidase [Novosphingobium kunmingense]PKB25072.1 phage repressor protein C with HTH and peptisase S24 domain [Novosphingobium kunmingense]
MVTADSRARLLELATLRGVSLSSLSELIGRNSTYLQQFIRKGSPRKLEETDRRTLARFFGVAESELGAPEEKSVQAAGSVRRGDWVDVPRLALGASAGPGALAGEEAAIGTFRFASRWLREQGLDPAQLSAIRVEGDSMEGTLRDGDEILVDRTPRPVRDGIHVVRAGDALLVKRLDTAQPGKVVLVSDNPAYRPIELTPDEVQVIGRVVWKSGRL